MNYPLKKPLYGGVASVSLTGWSHPLRLKYGLTVYYFPTQKRENISFTISSVAVTPVMLPKLL